MTHSLTAEELIQLYGFIDDKLGGEIESYVESAHRREDQLDELLRRTLAEYEGSGLIRQAAVLTMLVLQDPFFERESKRTAYAALNVFLNTNGASYIGDPVELARYLEQLSSILKFSALAEELQDFEVWLNKYVIVSGEEVPLNAIA